jgi:hypothetical protein
VTAIDLAVVAVVVGLEFRRCRRRRGDLGVAFADDGDDLADGDGVVDLGLELLDGAGDGGGDLGVDLVGGDLDDGLVDLDGRRRPRPARR